jgi:hypothetical protein
MVLKQHPWYIIWSIMVNKCECCFEMRYIMVYPPQKMSVSMNIIIQSCGGHCMQLLYVQTNLFHINSMAISGT